MTQTPDIVAKLWNLCHVLRDGGISYHQYVTELTLLLFLKMAKETGKENTKDGTARIPKGCRWDDLLKLPPGEEKLVGYRKMLLDLGQARDPLVRAIYTGAQTTLREARHLERLVLDIDGLDWFTAKTDGLGDMYEGLLEKNASETKSGAGQYFTPRPLIEAMVEVMKPQAGEVIQDPAAGTGGFLIAADTYIKKHTADLFDLADKEQKFQKREAFVGLELVPETRRLALMNCMLHDIDGIGEGAVRLGDTLTSAGAQLPPANLILTNPPFGTKKGAGGGSREDLTFSTSNKQLMFLQHIYRALKPGGRAAVVLPDNVLFEEGRGREIRADLMDKCNLHTILRLPTGIFYAQGVKTNVLFFTRGEKDKSNTKKVWVYDLRTNAPASASARHLRASISSRSSMRSAPTRAARRTSARMRASKAGSARSLARTSRSGTTTSISRGSRTTARTTKRRSANPTRSPRRSGSSYRLRSKTSPHWKRCSAATTLRRRHRVAGRNVKFVRTIPGRCALSVNDAGMPAPKGWAWVSLPKIARLESGHTPSRSKPEYWDGEIPWIGIKDARTHHGEVIEDTSQHVTQAGIDNSAARILPVNTVCLSRTASVGYVVIMGRPMATSQDFVNWVCSPAIDPEFLKWIFLAEGEEGLRKFGKGTTHTTIYFPEVEAFHACIAPINEQRRIVAKLDAIFERTRAAKARLERLPGLLDKLKRSILAAAFRGDLTADWRAAHPNVEPASALLNRVRAERRSRWNDAIRAKGKDPSKGTYEEFSPDNVETLPPLPSSWTWAGLSEVAELQLGQRRAPEYEGEDEYRYIRAANITWRGLDLSDVKTMGFVDTERLFLRPGDVILNEASGSPTEVGKPALWRGEIDNCCFQATVLRLRPTPTVVLPEWLYYSSLADALLGRIAAMAPGIGILHLTAERMRRWPIPIPPLAEQRVLAKLLADALERAYALEDRAEDFGNAIERLEGGALAKAFRGELVEQDPNDEHAQLLLERVRGAGAGSDRAGPRATQTKPPIKLRRTTSRAERQTRRSSPVSDEVEG